MNIYRISLLSIALLAMVSLRAMANQPKVSLMLDSIRNETNTPIKVKAGKETVIIPSKKSKSLQNPSIELTPGRDLYTIIPGIEIYDYANKKLLGEINVSFFYSTYPSRGWSLHTGIRDIVNESNYNNPSIDIPDEAGGKEVVVRINLVIEDPITDSTIDYTATTS